MECCLADGARKACALCPAIELSCKSAWIARRRSGTTSIAGPEHGREHAKAFSTLGRRGFECDWQRPFRPMPRPSHSIDSSTRRGLRHKTGSSDGSRCVAPPAKVSRLLGPIWSPKLPLLPRACTGIRWEQKMPIYWLRAISFLSPKPSRLSAAPSAAKANTRISWQESLTARDHLSGRLGQYPLEESLLRRGLPQCSVTIHMWR